MFFLASNQNPTSFSLKLLPLVLSLQAQVKSLPLSSNKLSLYIACITCNIHVIHAIYNIYIYAYIYLICIIYIVIHVFYFFYIFILLYTITSPWSLLFCKLNTSSHNFSCWERCSNPLFISMAIFLTHINRSFLL